MTYLAASIKGRSFFALTPVVTKAKEFVDKVQVLSAAAGSGSSSVALPSVSYGVDISNQPDSNFTNASSVNRAGAVNSDRYGLPSMTPGSGGTSRSKTMSTVFIQTILPIPQQSSRIIEECILNT